jgi:hypothetical protein
MGLWKKQAWVTLITIALVLLSLHPIAGHFRVLVTDTASVAAVLQFAHGIRIRWTKVLSGGGIFLVHWW